MDGWMDGWMDGETFSLEQNILFIFFLGQETQSPLISLDPLPPF